MWRRGVRRVATGVLRADGKVVGAVASSETARRLRKRIYQIRPSEVARVAEALDDAGVDWSLAGGWGIDALLGRRTRHHGDLDLCIDVSDDGEAKAIDALAHLGYELEVRRAPSGHRLPLRAVLRDRSGRTIDLILVTRRPPSPTGEVPPVLAPAQRTSGSIEVGDRRIDVPCLAPALQLELHCGYVPQRRDRHDVELLCEAFDLPLPSIYQRNRTPAPVQERLVDGFWDVTGRLRGISAIVLLVPEADPVRSAAGSDVPGSMPAHITLCYPFVSPWWIGSRTRSELAAIAASWVPMAGELPRLSGYGHDSFLPVDPVEPIQTATRDLLSRWPEHPPYGDPSLSVEPHVTVAIGAEPAEIAASVEPLLPVRFSVDEAVLMVRGISGRWRVRERFPLRGGPPESVS